MSGHTPGPWAVSAYLSSRTDQIRKNYVSAADGLNGNWRLFVTEGPDAEANAARIVACVNACEGINPDAVPDLLAALGDLIAEYTAAVDPYRSGGFYSNPDDDWPILEARAAIAKARSQ